MKPVFLCACLIAFVLLAFCSVGSFAQRPAAAQPSLAAPPASPGSPVIARLNGQPITLADIEPGIRELSDGYSRSVAELRRSLMDSMVTTALIEAEAARRGISSDKLVENEVKKKVPEPAEAEIRQLYETNKEALGGADLAAVRPRIIAFIKDQRAQRLAADLVSNLRNSHPVTWGEEVSSQTLKPASMLATIGGKRITEADLQERMKPFMYKLNRQLYEAQIDALALRVNNILLAAEAKKRNLTAEALFDAEVIKKARVPTEVDIQTFYNTNKAKMKGDLNSSRASILAYLTDHERQKQEVAFVKLLRTGAQIQVLLAEPEPPAQAISADDDPTKGPASAPVTIVMFTDFQCPSCAAMHPVVEEAMRNYAGRIRLVLRDFPLDSHANAVKAAQAANAARVQNKFFEYIDILYKNQVALDDASLKKYATQLGLDRARFDADLDSGKFDSEIEHDIADGERYGVENTPTLFVNGVLLTELNAAALKKAIDRVLSPGQSPPARPN